MATRGTAVTDGTYRDFDQFNGRVLRSVKARLPPASITVANQLKNCSVHRDPLGNATSQKSVPVTGVAVRLAIDREQAFGASSSTRESVRHWRRSLGDLRRRLEGLKPIQDLPDERDQIGNRVDRDFVAVICTETKHDVRGRWLL